MKFGNIKSKIDYVLLESYKNENHFKLEMKLFKKCVLENKNISKLYYLYDELTTKKNIDKSIANDFINECIVIYENVINKLKQSDLTKINEWLFDVNVENKYSNIDNLFSTDVTLIEEKIKSKKILFESLTKKEIVKDDLINLPISTMVNMANKTIENYIEGLNESDKQELIKFLSQDETEMKNNFDSLKNEIISKLNEHKINSDEETLIKINESINKIEKENFNKFSFFKMKNLNENL